MTTATLSLKIKKQTKSKAAAISLPNLNWKAVCFLGFVASLVLLFFYVWQVNDLTRGSYLINSYQRQVGKLSDENKNLQVSFAQNSFLGQVLQETQALNFQKVTSVQYVQVPDSNQVATTIKK